MKKALIPRWLAGLVLGVTLVPPILYFSSRLMLGQPLLDESHVWLDLWISIAFSFVVTVFVFAGALAIRNWVNLRYPWGSNNLLRVLLQFPAQLVYSVIVIVVITFLHKQVLPPAYTEGHSYPQNIAITLVITAIVSISLEVRSLYRLWRQSVVHQEQLKQAHLKAQLNFLRQQVNPHFLFNALNSIYFLIQKDPAQAQHLLMQFSDMLSHQLYGTEDDKIDLKEELAYVKKYIELEQVRMGESMHLSVEWPSNGAHWQIAPMLMQPLIENAFKFGRQSGRQPFHVTIKATLTGSRFTFSVENDFQPQPKTEKSGVGLQNLQQRLQLLYPNQHDFTTAAKDGSFKVIMEVPLHEKVEPCAPLS